MTDKTGPEKSIYTNEYAVVLKLLREARDRSGLTQIDLANKLGQTQSFVSKIERGDRRLDIIQLRSILRFLGMPLADFVSALERTLARSK